MFLFCSLGVKTELADDDEFVAAISDVDFNNDEGPNPSWSLADIQAKADYFSEVHRVSEQPRNDTQYAFRHDQLDVTMVFTDIQMPGSMDGLKLVRAVRGRGPPIKIVATSGLVDVGEKDLPEGGRFLAKPYRSEDLADVCEPIGSGQV